MQSHSNGEAAPAPPGWEDVVDQALAANEQVRGALLQVLHAVQDRLGFIPPEAQPRIAEGLNLSRAEVHGVVTFYHDFRSRAPGRHVLKLCRAESCQAMGSDALLEQIEARTGSTLGTTTPDGALTLLPVYCLGNCACSPALMIDGRVEGRVTAAKLDRIIAKAKVSS